MHSFGGTKMDFMGLTSMGCLPAKCRGNRGQRMGSFSAKLLGVLLPQLDRDVSDMFSSLRPRLRPPRRRRLFFVVYAVYVTMHN